VPCATCSTARAGRASIAVDGGVDLSNAARLVAAGATS
jgi:pentose-5-phosphate-3-epimerase